MQNTVNNIAQLLVKHNCYSSYFLYDDAVLDVLCNFINTAHAHKLANQYTQLLAQHNTLVNDVADAMHLLHGDVDVAHLDVYDTFTA